MMDLSNFGQAVADHRKTAARAWEWTFNDVTYRETEAAVTAQGNRGFDVSMARELLSEGELLYGAGRFDELAGLISEIYARLYEAPYTPDLAYEVPASLEDIQAACLAMSNDIGSPLQQAEYEERVLGGWLGKVIGGALGEPIEGWTHQKVIEHYPSLSNFIDNPPNTANDDPSYQVLLLHAIETYGLNFTSDQLAHEWVVHLPLEYAFTAERFALDNLKRGLRPPESGRVNNPFNEWVGAQMKGEICGWLTPGRPDLAMTLAHRDAIIAHAGEGIFGELFTAVSISAALVQGATVESVLEVGQNHVPAHSRFAETVHRVLDWCKRYATWQDAWSRVSETYATTFHWVHTLPNIAAVLIGLHYGEGDFERTLIITTQCGQDTDTNAAQAGALIGTLLGTDEIPSKWRDPIGDWLDLPLIGFERMRIDDLAQRTSTAGWEIVFPG